MGWLKGIASFQTAIHTDGKKYCVISFHPDSAWFSNRKYAMDKEEWIEIGKTMNWLKEK